MLWQYKKHNYTNTTDKPLNNTSILLYMNGTPLQCPYIVGWDVHAAAAAAVCVVCVRACMCVSGCGCGCVCVHVCMHAWVCAYMCACVPAHVCLWVWVGELMWSVETWFGAQLARDRERQESMASCNCHTPSSNVTLCTSIVFWTLPNVLNGQGVKRRRRRCVGAHVQSIL